MNVAPTGPAPVRQRFVYPSRVARLWWVHLPRLGRRWSPEAGATLSDGSYLGTLRVAGAVATPASLVLGYLAASHHWWYRTLPTESTGLLVLMVAIGAASAHVGGAFLTGYAVCDFFTNHTMWSYPQRIQQAQDYWPGERHLAYFARERVPLLILYVVLAVAVVQLPVATRRLLHPFLPGDRAPFALSAAMTFTGTVLLTFVTIYLWTQIAAVLVRPVYTWRGIEPLKRVIEPLQRDGATIARIAALVAGGRVVMQGLTVVHPHLAARADLLELELIQPLRHRSVLSRVPGAVRAVVPAAALTVVFAGFYADRVDAIIVFVVLLLVGLVQRGTVRIPTGGWGRAMRRVPVAVRLVVAVGAAYGYSAWISADRTRDQQSFRPLLIGLAVSAAIFVLVFPRPSAAKVESRGPDA